MAGSTNVFWQQLFDNNEIGWDMVVPALSFWPELKVAN
jgi:hypothetical protein